jgi:hypothetical protein
MNSISFPVVHPAFQKLKRSGRFLHLAAGILILIHALTHSHQPHSSPVYIGCLVFMALDIFILVMAGNNIAADMPTVNLFFRVVEVLFFLGIGLTLLLEARWFMGGIHLSIGLAYLYLFRLEKRLLHNEYLAIHHSGITIPALPDNRFLIWTQVNRIDAQYDSITIDTSTDTSYRFDLRKNLQFEELDQIHEFCRHYLGS